MDIVLIKTFIDKRGWTWTDILNTPYRIIQLIIELDNIDSKLDENINK